MKIVLAEKVSPATLAVFKAEPDWKILTHDQVTDLPASLADADGLVVRSAVQVDDKLLAAAPKLRVIGRAGVGVDNIDADAATRRGIVVMNTPGANAVAVAELTIGLMLGLARMVPKANTTMHAGKWEKKSLQGVELRNKKLGILGLGRIGLEVSRRARSFGMELIGHDPFVSAAVARENAIKLVSLEELFTESDYLTLHVGLTPQTTGIINAQTIATMKKGVRIINCARGELIVEEALADGLKNGQVGGAGLDVFHQEPLKNSPFFGLENVILTPHIAGSTAEAQEAVGVQIALQVREYLKLGVVQNAVNLPSLSHEEYLEVAPYIEMAGRLGAFLAQFPQGGIESIQLSYSGRIAEGKTELIRNSAIAGVLGHSENVNRINAAAVAQERGIRIHEEKEEAASGGAGSVLKLKLHTPSSDVTASATVLHGSSARLLSLDGIDIEAPLQGNLLTMHNRDVPGVIGRVGTILGDHKINIANFALGRSDRSERVPQGNALAVVQIDGSVTASVLDALRGVDAILQVHLVDLDGD
ncbi:MAG TPA: phosphoglycerate dehydrogenase [Pseudacidobacterium sp.]|jgi:D-3-phosphoglycerate dehydrogenase|nr:phosphoglycerate dehydrogenase [Pseudacidobacterium sp.]